MILAILLFTALIALAWVRRLPEKAADVVQAEGTAGAAA